MLIIANGAFKSGSTWLYQILREITKAPLVPVEYLESLYSLPNWKECLCGNNPMNEVAAINPKMLKDLLVHLNYKAKDYIAKNHFFSVHEHSLLTSQEDVCVFDIKRDIKDVVVSAYYHDQRVNGFTGDFKKYYWVLGRVRAMWVLKHHYIWSASSQRVYVASFEKLKTEFNDEVAAIGNFLGYQLSDNDIAEIKEQTTLENLQKKKNEQHTGQKFFRRGIVGDWMNHFDEEMLKDIESIKHSDFSTSRHLISKIRASRYISLHYIARIFKNKLRLLLTTWKEIQ